MKKRWIALLTACLVFILSGTMCFADLIYEPDNDFLLKNRNRTEYVERNFYINGSEGKAIVYDDPDSPEEFAVLVNGVELTVYNTYKKDRTEWGLVEFSIDEDGMVENAYDDALTGWMLMDDLLVVYDNTNFFEEHADEFYMFDSSYEAIIEAGEDAVLWTYPGSGEMAGTLYEPENLQLGTAYDDSDGRQWGFIDYHFGNRDVWICISDPTNENIPVFGVEAPELISPASIKSGLIEDLESQNTEFPIKIIIALVAVVVVATAILIPVLMRKKAKK